jgi:ketosteroid isomerase-like protein
MRNFLVLSSLFGLALTAQAADSPRTTEEVVKHHSEAMASAKLDEIMSDYADHAVLIDPSGATQGKEAIGKNFARMFGPGSARPAGPLAPPDKTVFAGEIAYLLWTGAGPGGRTGSETVVVRHGKIVAQTVAALRASGPPK